MIKVDFCSGQDFKELEVFINHFLNIFSKLNYKINNQHRIINKNY